jgi:hypothetical protein
VCEFENQPQKSSSQTFQKWFWIQKSILNPKKVVRTFFDRGLFSKTHFCGKKCAVFWSKIALWLKMRIFMQFSSKNSTFFHKKAFLKKGHDQKMFGPLFSDSVYISESKTTFGMFGIIAFAVDSQTHTL